MIHIVEPCIDANVSYKITVEVGENDYSAAKEAYVSGLPEDCYPAENAEIDYSITKIITFIDEGGEDEESLVSIGNNLDIPSRVNEMELTQLVLDAHEAQLKDDADCKADYIYESNRVRR